MDREPIMTQVMIALHGGTHDSVYHTDSNCPYVKRARNITHKEKHLIESHREECKWCANDRDIDGPTKWHTINNKLQNGEIDL